MSKPFNYQLFGLEQRDIAVYEAMLVLPKASSIREIAAKTRLNRGTAFEVIKKLSSLGLIGQHFKNKRRYYFAKPPSSLVSYAEEIQSSLSAELINIDSYVLRLKSAKIQELSEQFTQFFDGEDEIAALLRDVLDTMKLEKNKQYRVISTAEVRNQLYAKFRNFTRQRIKLGISVQAIGVGQIGSRADLSETRLLKTVDLPASYMIIYADKIAAISLSDVLDIRAVLIKDSGISKLQAMIFDHLWNSLTPD